MLGGCSTSGLLCLAHLQKCRDLYTYDYTVSNVTQGGLPSGSVLYSAYPRICSHISFDSEPKITQIMTRGYSQYVFAKDFACACCRVNPTGELRFDGTTVHPYDAMFVKMKRAMLQAETPAALNAIRYQQWMRTAVRGLHIHACYVIAGSQASKRSAALCCCMCAWPRL